MMRWPMDRLKWLLSACLISLLLLTPTDCDGLQLVSTIKKNSFWPTAPPPTFLASRVDDQLVGQLWLNCGLDMTILQDVKNQFHYNLLFHIISISYRTNNKNTSPPRKINIKERMTAALSPHVANNFLDCLSKHDFPLPHGVSGHMQEEDAGSLLPKSNNFKPPFASKRRYLLEGASTAHYSLSPPAKEAIRSVLSSEAEGRPLVASMKKAAKSDATKKGKDGDSGSSTAILGLAVVCIALVALTVWFCVCRGNEGASPYDLGRDDKPLLGLGDLTGSSRKSCATPIDVSRLGALPVGGADGSSSEMQKLESSFPIKMRTAPSVKLKSAGAMSMKQELVERHSRLASHEITTIAGRPAASNSPAEKATVSSATSSAVAPAGPAAAPPPPPAPYQNTPPPGTIPKAPGAAPPPPPPAPGPAPPPPPPKPTTNPSPGPPPPPPAPRGGAGAGPPVPPPPKNGGSPVVGPPPPALPVPGGPKACGPPPFKKSGPAVAPEAESSKTKLKPLFWDKVIATPNQPMVWDQMAGSFQFNEDQIETLFGCTVDKKSTDGKKHASTKETVQSVSILDPKKAQNLAISLKALGVSAEEVGNAVTEGHHLPSAFIESLLRWTPTNDEELRLRMYNGELSQLGRAEQLLKTIIEIPRIFERLEALQFMAQYPEEAARVKHSFETLEVACQELRHSRLFKKLLEAVLKTGNRMNDGTFRGGAQAFKLDTLLKLADVKGLDGKTTLLHFVVQEIIRSEGVRAVRLAKEKNSSISSVSSEDLTEDVSDDTEHYKQLGLGVVSSLGDDLQNVRKAASLDSDDLTISVARLGNSLVEANKLLKRLDEDSGFHRKLVQFIEQSQVQVTHLLEEEKKLRSLLRTTVDYFHGSTGKDEGLRLFVVVRDFLAILDKVCREVKEGAAKAAAANKKPAAAPAPTPAKSRQPSQSSMSFRDPRQHLKPAVQGRRGAAQSSSSSSDSDD